GVVEEVRVIPLGKIRPVMRAPRFLPSQRRQSDDFRQLEHEVELQRARELRIEKRILVSNSNELETFSEVTDHVHRLLQARAASIDADVGLRRLLHLISHGREAFPTLPLQQAVT